MLTPPVVWSNPHPKNLALQIREHNPSGMLLSKVSPPYAVAIACPPGFRTLREVSWETPPSPSWYPAPTPPTTSTRTSARTSCTCGASAQATKTLSSRSPRTSPPAFAHSSVLTHNTCQHSAVLLRFAALAFPFSVLLLRRWGLSVVLWEDPHFIHLSARSCGLSGRGYAECWI